MLQDYLIENQETNLSKWTIIIEFIAVLLVIQGVIWLFIQPIPASEALQFRIIPHSNAPADQRVKEDIQVKLAPLIEQAVNESTSSEALSERLLAMEAILVNLAQQEANGLPVTLERKAALIPPKRVGFAIQPQNVYDAYVLTLGDGRGNNWWCSLFPNVCFPEQSETVEKPEEEPVKFFVWEWITSWFA